MKTKLFYMMVLAVLGSVSTAQDGAVLFKNNCAVCHSVGKGKVVGPDLKGSHTKFKEDWLMKWIKSSQSLIKKGDSEAVKIYEENGKMLMPDQSLTDDQIKTVIAFIKAESEKPEEIVTNDKSKIVSDGSHAKSEPYDYKKKEASAMSWKAATFVMVGFCIVLIVVIIALTNTLSAMAKNISFQKSEGSHNGTQH